MRYLGNKEQKDAEKFRVYGWLSISLAFQITGIAFGFIFKWQQQHFQGFIALFSLNLVALFFCFQSIKERYGTYLDGIALVFEMCMKIRWEIQRTIERRVQ
jgi:FtsH-binding integral membrane protein